VTHNAWANPYLGGGNDLKYIKKGYFLKVAWRAMKDVIRCWNMATWYTLHLLSKKEWKPKPYTSLLAAYLHCWCYVFLGPLDSTIAISHFTLRSACGYTTIINKLNYLLYFVYTQDDDKRIGLVFAGLNFYRTHINETIFSLLGNSPIDFKWFVLLMNGCKSFFVYDIFMFCCCSLSL